ncbi:hypothetical protein BHE74_00016211 [Ensete ventricosum]|nr:hypothetical protein BHE74_00016211 [Ensete ventricosum]
MGPTLWGPHYNFKETYLWVLPSRPRCVARSQTDPLADHNHDTRRTTTAFCGPHRQHAPIGGSTWPVRKWGRSTSEWVDCGPGYVILRGPTPEITHRHLGGVSRPMLI